MPRYLISYTERKKNGFLKKRQGVRVKKFRRLLERQGIRARERQVGARTENLHSKWWDDKILEEARYPHGFLSRIGEPNIMIEFTW